MCEFQKICSNIVTTFSEHETKGRHNLPDVRNQAN